MPRRFFTSGRKFSTTTSAFAAIFLSTATPSGDFRFSVIERLLRCRFWKSEPSRGPPIPSPSLMCSGISILMQFAPQSASCRTQVGPARTRVRSSTVKRLSAVEARGKDMRSSEQSDGAGQSRYRALLSTGFALPDSRARNLSPLTLGTRNSSTSLTTSSAMTYALEIRGLCKSFDRPAVAGLDLCVRQGEFYSLLGTNGAGKTTTLRMVAGLLPPDAGTIAICGIDALRNSVEAKRIVAWVSDEPMIYDKLTPYEYLEFVAGLWGIDPAVSGPAAQQLLVSLGLEPHLHERCEGFSKGMRQKVALAGPLRQDPRRFILGEPLTGLDALSARHVKGLLGDRVRA